MLRERRWLKVDDVLGRWMKTTRWISSTSLVLALAASIMLAGCADSSSPATYTPTGSQRPATHIVKAGETLYHIANEYGVSVGRLMTANEISDPRELRVGEVLTIPGAYQAAYLGSAPGGAHPYTGERAARQFQWPVSQGVVSSGFGIRNGAMHEGVDIAAPAGTPVYAADSGVVIFSGILHGYGNTVIIRHDDDYATVYAHNERNLVSEGTRVASGQQIGEIGRSGRTTGANLHFEVRHDNVAQDPLAYLPEPTSSAGISFAAAGGS
jgi:murein DD-endopeptidase MepM/ murein hydrolase activator NlpD